MFIFTDVSEVSGDPIFLVMFEIVIFLLFAQMQICTMTLQSLIKSIAHRMAKAILIAIGLMIFSGCYVTRTCMSTSRSKTKH